MNNLLELKYPYFFMKLHRYSDGEGNLFGLGMLQTYEEWIWKDSNEHTFSRYKGFNHIVQGKVKPKASHPCITNVSLGCKVSRQFLFKAIDLHDKTQSLLLMPS